MSQLRLHSIQSLEDLSRQAAAWDDLWQRSDVALPTTRAEPLVLWLRQFAPRTRFHALLVEDGGQLVAALPLRGRRLKSLVEVADLPNNEWSANGDLLLDPKCDVADVLDLLVAGMEKTRWPLVWLDGIDLDALRWQAWLAAVHRARLSMDVHSLYSVAAIDFEGDWESFQSTLAGDFRRNVRRRVRRLREKGNLELRTCVDLQREQVHKLMQTAFEVEDQSWKGPAGTSVLRSPGMDQFFQQQAELLAKWNQWAMYCLEMDGRTIAFEFGYQAKGTFYAHKVSYLTEFQKDGPGHVLRWLQLPELFQQRKIVTLDYFGKVTEAAQRWMTRSYQLSRVVVALQRPLSRTLMAAYTKLWPGIRRLKNRWRPEDSFETSA